MNPSQGGCIEHVRPDDLGIGKLFERVRDAVIVADAKTRRIVLWNPVAERMFGYSASEALELRVEALVPERLKARFKGGISRYAETNHEPYLDSHRLLELAALKKGGEEVRVELSLSPIGPVGGANGGGRFVLAIVRDTTDRKRAQEANSRLAAIVESSDDAIISKTLDGVITSWNRGAKRIYGYPAEEVVGRPITILVPPDHHDEIPEILRRVRRGEKVDHYETERIRKDGGRIHVSLTVSPIADSAGNIFGASAVARDVTERRRAEEKIRRLNEELEERVAERTAALVEREGRLKELVGKLVTAQEEERRRVAYELHDGLTQVAIAAHQYLQAFADGHPPGSTVGEGELDWVLELAQRTVKEARRVIEGLRPTALDDFGLAVAVRQLVEDLAREGWEVGYEEDIGEGRLPPQVETALYRVAQEALANARKHAKTTRARVALRRLGKVHLEIADDGRGFDPVASGRATGPGEKVGLLGMRERVALLGGRLEVKSEPGRGTVVIAEVPVPVPGANGGRA
jgi:PAS domain S-box-containing protein